jgi:cell division protein FtsQ
VKKRIIIPTVCTVLAALIILAFYKGRIETIVYTGNTQNEESTLTDLIFGKFPNRVTYYLFHSRETSIPNVYSYRVSFNDTEADVQINEKSKVGYIRFMGANMYFDSTGTIVESTDEIYENVPEITGLDYDSLIVGQKIDTQEEMVLKSVLTFAQNFSEYDLPVTKVDFTDTGDIVLTMNDVEVQLGTTDHLSDKLYQLSVLYPELENRSGTLYLSSYDGTQSRIVFRDNTKSTQTETESETTATEETQTTEETAAAEETAADASAEQTDTEAQTEAQTETQAETTPETTAEEPTEAAAEETAETLAEEPAEAAAEETSAIDSETETEAADAEASG